MAKRIPGPLSKPLIIETMKYLGHQIHDEYGTVLPAVKATADALAGKVVESVMLPSVIATELAKHQHAP